MSIAFIGMTHLGLVSAVGAAIQGHEVICYDADVALIAQLQQGIMPVSEPLLEESIRDNRGRLHFTSDLGMMSTVGLLYIAPDVPTNKVGVSDLRPLRAQIQSVLAILHPKTVVVIHSQVPPGFCRSIEWEHLFYHVETLVFGQAIQRATQPERFIIGKRNQKDVPQVLYSYLTSYRCPILEMSYESAELTKISINLFLISSVTTTNLLARISGEIGADWDDIKSALQLDRRIGPHAYLNPGLGISGGNLERDMVSLTTLAHHVEINPILVETWLQQSKQDLQWVFNQLKIRNLHSRKKIGCLGLAYKKDTASIKNSPAISLLSQLTDCKCCAYDPRVKTIPLPHVQIVSSPTVACQGVDALVVMTPWDEFASLSRNILKDHTPLIIDPYGVLPHAFREEYEYLRIGARTHDEKRVSAGTTTK